MKIRKLLGAPKARSSRPSWLAQTYTDRELLDGAYALLRKVGYSNPELAVRAMLGAPSTGRK